MQNRFRWVLALWVQLVAMSALSAAVALIPLYVPDLTWMGPALRWGLMTVGGGISAYLATRKGLNHYAAWFAPPVMYGAIPWALIGYPPETGPLFLVAFLSVVGAATGDVKNRWGGK